MEKRAAKSADILKKGSPEALLKALKAARDSLPTPAALLETLESQGVASPIVLAGAHPVRIRRTIDWIREAFFADDKTACSSNFGIDLQSAASVKSIISTLGSPSLFSPTQLLIIYEADKIRAAAAAPLGDALALKNAAALVILTCEKFNPRAPLFSRLPKKRSIVEFKDFSPALLKRWIAKEVALCGSLAGIEPKAVDVLIRCYGSDVSALSREIQKLSLLAAPEEKIDVSLVEELTLRTPEVTSFELMQQMAKKNVGATNVLTRDLLGQGLHPLQLCSFLSRCIRTLLANHGHATAADDESGLAAELANSWFIRNLSGAGRLFSKTELRSALEILKDLDFKLKDSGLPNELALGIAVERIAGRNFR
jgi:DNA polymerase-3 subunit delta